MPVYYIELFVVVVHRLRSILDWRALPINDLDMDKHSRRQGSLPGVSHVGSRAVVWREVRDGRATLVAEVKRPDPDEVKQWRMLVGLEAPLWGLVAVLQKSGSVIVVAEDKDMVPIEKYLQSGVMRSEELRRILAGDVRVHPRFRDNTVPVSAQLFLDQLGNVRVSVLPWLQNRSLGAGSTASLDTREESALESAIFGSPAPRESDCPALPETGGRLEAEEPSKVDLVVSELGRAEIPELDESLPATKPTKSLGIAFFERTRRMLRLGQG